VTDGPERRVGKPQTTPDKVQKRLTSLVFKVKATIQSGLPGKNVRRISFREQAKRESLMVEGGKFKGMRTINRLWSQLHEKNRVIREKEGSKRGKICFKGRGKGGRGTICNYWIKESIFKRILPGVKRGKKGLGGGDLINK